MHGIVVVGLGPGLAGQHVLDVDVALFDHAGLGVEDAIRLPLGVDGLALQDDDADVAVLEVAAALHRLHQLLVVQVALAEVPPDERAGDDFALPDLVVGFVVDRARQQPVERPAMHVHRAEGGDFVRQHFRGFRVVEPRQLIDDERRALHDVGVDPFLGARTEAPHTGGPVAGVVPHCRKE